MNEINFFRISNSQSLRNGGKYDKGIVAKTWLNKLISEEERPDPDPDPDPVPKPDRPDILEELNRPDKPDRPDRPLDWQSSKIFLF